MVPRKEIFFSRKFNVTQLLYYGCHHTWRMPEIQDCNGAFCESFAKVPRELRESWGWDLKGGALSFSQLPHFHTYSLPLSLSLSYSHSLNVSPHSVTLSVSLSSSRPLSLPLSLTLFLFLLLNEPVIRIMHGDGSAKVSRKGFFLVKLAISGTRNLRQHPHRSRMKSSPARSRQCDVQVDTGKGKGKSKGDEGFRGRGQQSGS